MYYFHANCFLIQWTLRGVEVSMLTHAYKFLRKSKVAICNHLADCPLQFWRDVWCDDARTETSMVVHDTKCLCRDQVSLYYAKLKVMFWCNEGLHIMWYVTIPFHLCGTHVFQLSIHVRGSLCCLTSGLKLGHSMSCMTILFFYTCKLQDQTCQATSEQDCQPGDCRWPHNLPQGFA